MIQTLVNELVFSAGIAVIGFIAFLGLGAVISYFSRRADRKISEQFANKLRNLQN